MKYILLILILYWIEIRGKTHDDSSYDEGNVSLRITQGESSKDKKFPFMVSIVHKKKHICGGTIATPTMILTSASCFLDQHTKKVYSTQQITVSVGSIYWAKGDKYKVDKIILHEDYNLEELKHDIALVHLEKSITARGVDVVKLRSVPLLNATNFQCIVAGWGYYTADATHITYKVSNVLQYVIVNTTSLDECRKYYGDKVHSYHLCVQTEGGAGSCNADSGGPLLLNGDQIGIVAYGAECQVGIPEIYTKVAAYYSWIRKKIKTNISRGIHF